MKEIRSGCSLLLLQLLAFYPSVGDGYVVLPAVHSLRNSINQLCSSSNNNNNELSELLTSRLPTSVDDQIRQASESIKRATASNKYRHIIRLLLPVIGATDLDDWPGGSRQQMEAANPLVQSILKRLYNDNDDSNINIQTIIIDESDGVAALYSQGLNSKDDSCTILLPTAETITETIQTSIEKQVGNNRNLILVNPQWRRKTDFGGNNFFGNNNKKDKIINYIEEQYIPTFSLTNFICEGEAIRVLRTYPGPWRIFLQIGNIELNNIDWIQIGTKDIIETKPINWDNEVNNQRDGGLLFNYGQPSYQEIINMIIESPNYKIKNPAERAAAAFNFIKDTL